MKSGIYWHRLSVTNQNKLRKSKKKLKQKRSFLWLLEWFSILLWKSYLCLCERFFCDKSLQKRLGVRRANLTVQMGNCLSSSDQAVVQNIVSGKNFWKLYKPYHIKFSIEEIEKITMTMFLSLWDHPFWLSASSLKPN